MSDTLALVGATIIDGNGGPPIPAGTILIEGERIVAVGGQETAIPSDAKRIDAAGKFVIPGMMDANVHLVFGFTTEYLLRFENQYHDIIKEAAQISLKNGVTTVFDTCGPLRELANVRDEINRGEVEASRIFLAGNIVGLSGPFSPDFYASTASVGKETVRRINEKYEYGTGRELIYMGPEEVRTAIRKYLTNEIDFVKYAVSGHARNDWGFILFSPGVQRIIVDETHRRGITVQTHTTSIESLRMAVDAGVDLMQHPDNAAYQAIPDELAHKIAESKIPCVMMVEPERFLRHSLNENFDIELENFVDPWQRFQAAVMRNRKKLIRAGATVLMATDGGVPYPGDPLLEELVFHHPYPEIIEDMVGFFDHGHAAWQRGAREAGLSSMAALQAATKNVAAAYRKLDDLGTLEPKKFADLVVLDTDPLSDPKAYGAIHLVIKAGRVANLAALPNMRVISQAPR